MHDCGQDERVRLLERRVDRMEERIDANQRQTDERISYIHDSIKDIQRGNEKLKWWIISLFASSTITLLTILLKS